MLAVRVKYKKEGKAKYISHLDLIRCMMRALRRANISIYYTQGFNPHPHMVFALPLPLFFESICEVMDMSLNDELELNDVKDRINANLPEGITITDVTLPKMKLKEVAFAKYEMVLEFDGKTKEELESMVKKVLSNDKISIEKNSKKGPVQVEIKEYLECCDYKFSDEKIEIEATLPAGSQLNISPALLIAAFKNYGFASDIEYVKRTAMYNSEMKAFE